MHSPISWNQGAYIMLITLENLESYVNKIPQFVFLLTLITCLIAKYQLPSTVEGLKNLHTR